MNSTNRSFFEACNNVQASNRFAKVSCTQDKVIFALAQLKQATIEDITAKLSEIEPAVNAYTQQKNATEVLDYLFARDMVKITKQNGELSYNLVV
jgi:hypothetical protein